MVLRLRKSPAPSPNECPIGACMDLLGGAWTPNVIWQLQAGARRFSELQTYLKPITAKVLSQRLKELESKGVISRRVLDTTPPSVEYELTELGKDLVPAIEAIAEVGFKLRRSGAISAAE
jgi:DNA-binding HxlR family transcriptional regulator